jgi:hypothetical protein
MTTYTFSKNYNTGIFNNSFHTSSKPNYSKILDDIIISDVIKKNSYLFNTPSTKNIDSILLGANDTYTDLDKATLFLANYKKYKKIYNIPYALNKMYTLSDGTPIIFYDDEVQIGFDTYKYTDFSDLSFINALTPKKKNIIINIFNTAGANIKINLL